MVNNTRQKNGEETKVEFSAFGKQLAILPYFISNEQENKNFIIIFLKAILEIFVWSS